jgi:hypothetical protein
MPVNDAKDLRLPIKYKLRRVARELSKAEIKAAADRAEARSIRATTHLTDNPRNPASGIGLSATRLIEG